MNFTLNEFSHSLGGDGRYHQGWTNHSESWSDKNNSEQPLFLIASTYLLPTRVTQQLLANGPTAPHDSDHPPTKPLQPCISSSVKPLGYDLLILRSSASELALTHCVFWFVDLQRPIHVGKLIILFLYRKYLGGVAETTKSIIVGRRDDALTTSRAHLWSPSRLLHFPRHFVVSFVMTIAALVMDRLFI